MPSRGEFGFAASKYAVKIAILRGTSCSNASTIAQMIKGFPIRYHAGIYEPNEDLARGITLLWMGLATSFIGVHTPQLSKDGVEFFQSAAVHADTCPRMFPFFSSL